MIEETLQYPVLTTRPLTRPIKWPEPYLQSKPRVHVIQAKVESIQDLSYRLQIQMQNYNFDPCLKISNLQCQFSYVKNELNSVENYFFYESKIMRLLLFILSSFFKDLIKMCSILVIYKSE